MSMTTSYAPPPALARRTGTGTGSRFFGQLALGPLGLRLLLVLGSLGLACLAAGWATQVVAPTPYLTADPGLARLLRGMAAIKAGITLAVVGVLFWRFARPLPRRLAIAWLLGAWTLAVATALIWELRAIAPAAIAYHVAGIAMLVLALRDDRIAACSSH